MLAVFGGSQRKFGGETVISKYLESLAKNWNDAEKVVIRELSKIMNYKSQEWIEKNKIHIEEVKNFIQNSTTEIPISDKQKLKIVELASNKEIKYQDIGDAIIIHSIDEYVSSFYSDTVIFVTDNLDDFNIIKKGDDFSFSEKSHLEFINNIKPTDNLPAALKLSDKLKKEWEESLYEEMRIQEGLYENSISCLASCKGEEYYSNIVYLEDIEIDIINGKYTDMLVHYNPMQQQLTFEDEYLINTERVAIYNDRIKTEKGITVKAKYGRCEHCHSLHILCDSCDEELILFNEEAECGCGITYFLSSESSLCAKKITN